MSSCLWLKHYFAYRTDTRTCSYIYQYGHQYNKHPYYNLYSIKFILKKGVIHSTNEYETSKLFVEIKTQNLTFCLAVINEFMCNELYHRNIWAQLQQLII